MTMRKTLLLYILLFFSLNAKALPATSNVVANPKTTSALGSQTVEYVRCWYRLSSTHNDATTDWKWALNDNGSYYMIPGYWYSSISFGNMFYTNESQKNIMERCQKTLGVSDDSADITYFAADTAQSYNYAIWTNDKATLDNKINRIVSFGDSLSDTGNLFNVSQWLLPNPNTWFVGHFSNGFVWTEYLAKAKGIPVYNWAVGGAGGETQYHILTGVDEQVNSYLRYMKEAKNYHPENTLFTMVFGLNDFVKYDRDLDAVKIDFADALKKLTDSGAKNIILLTLPDVTKSPKFKHSDQNKIQTIRGNIVGLNQYIVEQVKHYKALGYNIVLYDAAAEVDKILTNPKDAGLLNTTESCLNIKSDDKMDYLFSYGLTNDCAHNGADSYLFWDQMHPTTAVHKYLANKILATSFTAFTF